MSSNLSQRVAATAEAASRLRWAYAGLRVIAGALGVIIVLGIVDALWRGQDVGTRLMLSSALLAGWVALAWREFRPVARERLAPLEVAQRIDHFYPQLNHRLASAIAFAAEPERDPLVGSLELRRHVLLQTESLADSLDFTAVLDSSAAKRAGRLALASAAAAILLLALAPRSSATALARLALPLAPIEWPRTYHLEWIEAPRHAARGHDVEFVLGGRLPPNVELQLSFESSGRSETRSMSPINGRMVYRLENVTESLRYRARGGDDDTLPWIELNVVEPPEFQNLTTKVTPPVYTGWPVQNGGGLVRLLAGSTVEVAGSVDRPIFAVRLIPENSEYERIEGTVAADRHAFQIPAQQSAGFSINHSGRWRLEIEDEQAVRSRPTDILEFRAVADQPPQIECTLPVVDTYLTPDARLTVLGKVTDDLGIAQIQLQATVGETSDAEPTLIPLYVNEKRESLVGRLDQMSVGVGRKIDFRWNVREHFDLKPGDILTIALTASDFSPQESKTPPRRLAVVTREMFEQWAQKRQAGILEQVTSVAKLAREARSPTREIELRWKETGRAQPADATRLQAAEFRQRQVGQTLSDLTNGIQGQVEQLLNDLSDNQLGSGRLGRQLKELRDTIATIDSDLLPKVGASLNAALKELRAPEATSAPPLAAVVAAGKGQDETIDSLDRVLAELNEWDTLARLSRELARIRDEQESLHQKTSQLQLNLAAATAGEMPERVAESKQLSQQQFDLTRQVDRLLVRMSGLHKKTVEHSGESGGVATQLAEALNAAERTGVSGLMQEAGRALARERAGNAAETQLKCLAALAAVLDALSGRAEKELQQRIEQLEAAAAQLEELAVRQDRERQATDQAAKESNREQQRRLLQRIGRSEERLAKEAGELSSLLERLRTQPAARAAAKASEAIAAAGDAAKRGETEETQQATREAQAGLQEARRQLLAAVRQAQADLVQEEMARLEQLIGDFVARQNALLDSTKQLEAARLAANGQWQREQLVALQFAASDQRKLAQETSEKAGAIQSPAFALTLRGASQEMQRAAARLDNNDAGPATQQAEQAALGRLKQLRQVLEEQDDSIGGSNEPMPNEDNSDEPPNVQSASELKLLLLMQQEINRRTSELERQRQPGEAISPELERQVAELAMEQAQIVGIVQRLLTRSKSEEAREELPERPPARKDKP